MKRGRFDEIVSLGYNCEISFRIRNYLGYLNSWPFSWSYILQRDKFVEALNDRGSIFQGEVSQCEDKRVNSMLQCEKYEICFHPRGEYEGDDGKVRTECFAEAVSELRSRVSHLIDKFNGLLASEKKTLFIVGISPLEESAPVHFISDLYYWLNTNYISGKFCLVAVFENADYKKYKNELVALENDRLYVRKIKKFGIQRCNDISTDGVGWWKIFREFYGKSNLKYFFRLWILRASRVVNAVIKRFKRLFQK